MIKVQNATAQVLANALTEFVKKHFTVSRAKDLAIGFDDCNTNIGETNGVKKAYLKTQNPYIICFWCFTHRLNLTVKEEILQSNLFKDFMHQVYHFSKKSAAKVIMFRKLQESHMEKWL